MLFFSKKKPTGPVIRPRADHNISRKKIAPEALNVLYRLSDAGYTTYLVGGGVRDMLLGRKPKDFDVATDAQPREIKKLFRNAHLIGRRFRLALICFKDRQIETSTFRREPDPTEAEDDGRPGALYRSEDNLFGTPEQDALRRDFTVNGLFYDIKTFAVIDYVGGLEDLKRKLIRSIGDPNVRFREDPVRMLRAIRFASKLGFEIHRDSEKAILRHHAEIANASPPRLFEEITRLFGAGAAPSFRLLSELRLMGDLLPAVQTYVASSGGRRSPLWGLLEAFDAKAPTAPLAEDPALRFATLLYPLYRDRVRADAKAGRQTPPETIASDLVGDALVNPFAARTWCPPRSLCEDVAQILSAQSHFDTRNPALRRPRVLNREWLPAALLLYRIRTEQTGGDLSDVEAWEAFVTNRGVKGRVRTSDEVFLDGRLPQGNGRSDRPRRERRERRPPAEAAAPAETTASPQTETSTPAPHRRRRRRRRRGGRHGDFPVQETPTP